tara:strand:- start:289 stop:876 length:588 start_codon:yes stop_codon:yes gene_type:complete
MNFQIKALEHLEAARAALASEPSTSSAWSRMREELHLALEAATLAEHLQRNPTAEKDSEVLPVSESIDEIHSLPPEAVETVEIVEAIEEPEQEVVHETTHETEPAAGPSVADVLSEQRIASLQNTMSINDRVRFAGDLFGGDVQKLLMVCGELEKTVSYAEAVAHLKKHASAALDWENEEGAPFDFLQKLRRLFA